MDKEYVIDNPNLIKEWHFEKNDELGLDPKKLTCGSAKRAWWRCAKGHEWQARIGHRNKGSSCPYCSGRYAIKGENDLQTLNPSLAKEWNYVKNNGLTPMDVMPNSGKKVWWKCNKGHEWLAIIAQRNYGTGCPNCNSEKHTSFPEYALVYYLKKYGIDVIHSYKEKGYELDVYIPSKKIAVEYDGEYWHKNKEKKDLEKNLKCKRDGIRLYRIREGLVSLNDYSIDYVVQNNKVDLSKIIGQLLYDIANINADIDLDRDGIVIENLRIHTEKKKSLIVCNPEIAKEWDYGKNWELTPEKFTSRSGKKVWWICNQAHSYRATIANRINGKGCPFCTGQKVLQGYNDLATLNLTLTQEWNYEKNGVLKPENFTVNSGKKVWWKCGKGHDYLATIIHRNKGGGCPYCLNQKLLPGYNDLATRNPRLTQEWDYNLNKALKPTDVFLNGHQKVWWKCSKGHPSYQATISNRNYGKGGPYCAGQRVLKGKNHLQTVNTSLAAEWNHEKNDGLIPADFMPNSNKKVWWKCSKGHEWQAIIANRNLGGGCPYCSGKKVLCGYSDLETSNPNLAKEWNHEKNDGLIPADFMPNSSKKVWWKCSKGHEWQTRIAHRNKGSGCPYCAKEKRKKK